LPASKTANERGAKSRQVLLGRGSVDEHDAIAGADEPGQSFIGVSAENVVPQIVQARWET